MPDRPLDAEPDVSFTTSFDEASSTLAVAGELDESVMPELSDVLERVTEGWTRAVVVDLGQVTYLPSAAVGVFVKAIARSTQTGHPVELLAGDGTFAAVVLGVTGLPFRSR